MHISDWKPFQKNTLRGSFTLTLNSGLVVHKCTVHIKNGSRWIGLPAEKYTKRDGSVGYSNTLEFTDRKIADNFSAQVVRLLDAGKFL